MSSLPPAGCPRERSSAQCRSTTAECFGGLKEGGSNGSEMGMWNDCRERSAGGRKE